MNLEPIESRLTEAIGVDPSTLSRTGLQGAVRRRMEVVGTSSVDVYAGRVRRDARELDLLAAAVLVHETSFFRYPPSFDLLVEEARRRLAAAPDRKFRIRSVACATGEEPASAVIALLEAGFDPEQIRVDADDVSRFALEYAEVGRYRERTLRAVPDPIRARYFVADDDRWRLDPRVVRHIRYRAANVIDPSFGRDEGTYDAVFCRNLMIYLVPGARRRLLDALCGMLAPGGLLFVGHAEVAAVRARGLPAERPPDAFACRRVDAPTDRALEPERELEADLTPAAPDDPREEPPRSAQSPSAAAPAEALLEAARRADAGDLAGAREVLEAGVRDRTAGADHYHLLAVVESAAGREEESERALVRALYLDPGHHPSLVQMALLAEQRGETARARRLMDRAERVNAEGEDDHDPV